MDTRPPAVKAACQRPGKYLFKGVHTFFFEVDNGEKIYQLTPELERDGFLSNSGWGLNKATQSALVYRLTLVNLDEHPEEGTHL